MIKINWSFSLAAIVSLGMLRCAIIQRECPNSTSPTSENPTGIFSLPDPTIRRNPRIVQEHLKNCSTSASDADIRSVARNLNNAKIKEEANDTLDEEDKFGALPLFNRNECGRMKGCLFKVTVYLKWTGMNAHEKKVWRKIVLTENFEKSCGSIFR